MACATLLVGSFAVTQAVIGDGYMQVAPRTSTSTPAHPAAALIEEHSCWTGEAPADMAGVLPGHVVVTVGGVTRLGGERMVGKALEQIFEGADHGLVVHGFCR